MDTINRKKAFKLFIPHFWKTVVGVGVIFGIVRSICYFAGIQPSISIKPWILFSIILLLFILLISLVLLINELIKREISDKTKISIPDQLLDIMSKLPSKESEVLRRSVDRYFHLYGHHKKRIILGKQLLKENRDSINQVENLIDHLGWANHVEGRTDLAVPNINQGVELAAKNLLYYWAAKGERHLAGIEKDLRNDAEYQKHMKLSREYTELIQNPDEKNEMEGSLHLIEAKYLTEHDNLSDAEEEVNQAKQLLSNDPRRQLKVYVALGNIYLKREQWEKAYNYFSEGYDKSGSGGSVRHDERAKNAIGRAKIHLNPKAENYYDIKRAKEFLEEAESLKSSLKQREIKELYSLLNGLN